MTPQEAVATALLDLLEDRPYRLTRTPSQPSLALANRRHPIPALARELSQVNPHEMDPWTPSERAAIRIQIEAALLGIFGA